jgi:hypothetical protein
MDIFKRKKQLQIPVINYNTAEEIIKEDNSKNAFIDSRIHSNTQHLLELPIKPICK